MARCPAFQILGVALGIFSCTPDDVSPDEKSAYVDLYLDDGLEVCAGQLPAYDAFLDRTFSVWGEQEVGDFRAQVHVLSESECTNGLSCTKNGEAFLANQWSQYHELGHVMHHEVEGNSITSLQEGTAEALGPIWEYVYEPDELADVDYNFLFQSDEEFESHGHAATFMRYLLEAHGSKKSRALFRRMGEIGDPSQSILETEFESAFEVPLADSWSEFTSARRCAYDFWYCDVGTLVSLPYSIDGFDCSDPETLGYEASSSDPKDDYGPMRIIHVENTVPRTLEIEIENALFYIGKCGDCSEQHWLLGGKADDGTVSFELDVEPGVEVLIVQALADAPRVAIREAS